MGNRYLGMALATIVAGVGCAGGATPIRSLEQTKAAIRAAEEVGADKVPRAALHLQLAKEESQHASDLIAQGEKDEAASYLGRAEADADLAVALARQNQEKADADGASHRVRELKQQNQVR